jgi:hydrogenase maturation protease
MTTVPRILVAGIGNIFLDDAFGSEVARRLLARPAPEGVRIVDFGIRSFDLTYALLDGYDAVILIDAVPRGEAPGTLYVIEPELDEASASPDPDLLTGTHDLDPEKVLRLAVALGGKTQRVLLVGCEPSTTEESMELSAPVQSAVDEAVALVETLIAKLRLPEPETTKPLF